ncbi:MAG: 8-oxo-dGTP diphosphatase [bacterium]
MANDKEIKLLTLCLYQKDGRVLLGMKKEGFGTGRWNGFGGKVKVDLGETIEQAARREMAEECGLTVKTLREIGVINFEFVSQPGKIREMHIFITDTAGGEPMETNEMKPEWFAIDAVPYEEMWGADRKWMPLALAGQKFEGWFLYNTPEDDEILEHRLSAMEVPA